MTVKDLIKVLKRMPQNATVLFANEAAEGYDYVSDAIASTDITCDGDFPVLICADGCAEVDIYEESDDE